MVEAAFAAACALLAAGGVAKVVRPGPAAAALKAVGLPSDPRLVRALGAGEAIVGVTALVTGARPLAALVGAAYLAFAAFVVAAIQTSGDVRSCGCFGAGDTPPSPIHVAVDLAFAAVALAAAVRGVDDPTLASAALAASLTYVGYVLLAVLPRQLAARHAQPHATTGHNIADIAIVGVPHRTVLVFLSSTCLTCREIWPRLAPLGDARVVAVTKGPEAEVPAKVEALAPTGVPVVLSTEAWRRYGVTVAPAVVVVDGATGAITAAATIRSWDDVSPLVSSNSRP